MSNTLHWVWYNCAMHGRYQAAYEIYNKIGSIEKIYRYTEKDYREAGITNDGILQMLCNKDLSLAEKELWYANNYNVLIIPIDSDEYPKSLKEIFAPPVVLYVRGSHFYPDRELCVAMVGTRRCSEYGRKMAYTIAGELAEKGITVVSCMSSQIDCMAHQGCLSHGGKTISVLGNGVNKAYPKANKDLMLNIMNSGAVISEYGFSGRVYPTFFRDRNRIITGLCKGVLIVEAAEKSGAMIVASCALEQNRDLFAVPGNATSPSAQGVNRLIKNCAKPVTCADDIIMEYESIYSHLLTKKPFTHSQVEFEMPEASSETESKILNALNAFPKTNDELARELYLDISTVNGILTMLEMTDQIEEEPDGRYNIVKK